MSIRTDSYTVDQHDDGSKTVTEVYTVIPPTKAQQVTAWSALGLVCVGPFLPFLGLAAWDKYQEKREARKAAKLEKKSK